MNRERRNDELPMPVRRYLEEVAHMEPPDDLMHTTMAEVESQPRASRFSLPAYAGVAAIAAALAAVAIIGANLLNGGVSVGAPGSPTPTPAATSEQPWNLVESPAGDNLPAGAYYLDLPVYPGRIDFDVPEGWWHYFNGSSKAASDVHAVLVNSYDSGAANGSAWGVAFATVAEVRANPCDPSEGTKPGSVMSSLDRLVAALETWEDVAPIAVSVRGVSIGGFHGRQVELIAGGPCSGVYFVTPGGYEFGVESEEGGFRYDPETYTFLDVDGSLLLVWTTDYAARNTFEMEGGASEDPQAHVQDQVALHEILDSIAITPR